MNYNNAYPPSQPRIGRHRSPGVLLLLYAIYRHIRYLLPLLHAPRLARNADFDLEPDTSPAVELLLTIVTFGLYSIYWDYKTAGKIARMQQKVGLYPTDNATMFLLLNLFGCGIFPSLIEQGHLNEIWRRPEQSYAMTSSYYTSQMQV